MITNLFISAPPAGHDFCSEGHGCMEHSDCVNLEAGGCCVCRDGFRPLRDDNAYCEGEASLWLMSFLCCWCERWCLDEESFFFFFIGAWVMTLAFFFFLAFSATMVILFQNESIIFSYYGAECGLVWFELKEPYYPHHKQTRRLKRKHKIPEWCSRKLSWFVVGVSFTSLVGARVISQWARQQMSPVCFHPSERTIYVGTIQTQPLQPVLGPGSDNRGRLHWTGTLGVLDERTTPFNHRCFHAALFIV